jgi:DNA processing protein
MAGRNGPGNTDDVGRLRLARSQGVGPVTYRRLMQRYRTADAALAALPALLKNGGRPADVVSRSVAEDEIARTAKFGARLVFLDDPAYPPLLAETYDAPPCLIAHGDAALMARRCIAAVGGRNASSNGQRMAEELAAGLAASMVVVSGLARGIDTAAHRGAMRTGRTIAVIAGGLDQPYPPENQGLQRSISESGLVLTEAAIGTVPQARHFPRRNRIIAGLSLGVVVVEAAPRSGSLITARIAQEIGREVFAVPGSPLDPRARGGNDLIRQGAVLVENEADVLDNLPLTEAPIRTGLREISQVEIPEIPAEPPPASATETVLALLSPEPTMVDDLVRRCQLSAPVTMAVLLELELAGRIETVGGSRVALLPHT